MSFLKDRKQVGECSSVEQRVHEAQILYIQTKMHMYIYLNVHNLKNRSRHSARKYASETIQSGIDKRQR